MTSQAMRRALYPQETAEAGVVLLNLDHEDFDAPLFLTDMVGAWDAGLGSYVVVIGGTTYWTAPIEVVAPGSSDEHPKGRLRVPNVDQRIGQAIDRITGPLSVTLTVALASDPATPIAGPYDNLMLVAVKGNALTFEGDLVYRPLGVEPWPRQWIRPGKFRAAFR